MAIASLVLQYVKSLAWPLVLIAAIFIFRGEVRGLFRRLSSLAGAGFDLKFEADVQSALATAQVAAAQELTEVPGGTRTGVSPIVADAPPEEWLWAIEAMRELAKRDPDTAVVAAWQLVEAKFIVRSKGKIKATGPTGRPPSVAQMIDALDLPRYLIESIRDLRVLRNRVVHSGQSITAKAADDYMATVKLVFQLLDSQAEAEQQAAPS